MVRVTHDWFIPQINRIIVLCPTFRRQKTFDPIRSFVKEKDIYTQPNNASLKKVMQELEFNLNRADATGVESEKVLVIIDDVAGQSVIQCRRQGPFANFAVQSTHWNVSLFVLTQQPTCCDPNFRDNAEHITYFPSPGECSYNWLKKSYTCLEMNKHDMKEVILLAQYGGSERDPKERGKHFLYIYKDITGVRFFIDFGLEIKVHHA